MRREIDEEAREWLEWQAYAFAGLVLVSSDCLDDEFGKAVWAAARAGLSIQRVGEVALPLKGEVAGAMHGPGAGEGRHGADPDG